jgi:predicted nucleic acid-binding protein
MAKGRKARGRRAIAPLIAATAMPEGLPLYTRNPEDFRGLDDLVVMRAVGP